jgi:myosin heavy subunit
LNSLSLSSNIEDYYYINSSTDASSIPNVSDASDFLRVKECLSSVFDSSIQFYLFQLLSGILHLGNVNFQENESADHVAGIHEESKESFNKASKLLGFEENDLFNCLAKQNMYVNNNIIIKQQNLSQTIDKKHSFAKNIYSNLFSWLIEKLNSTITPSNKTAIWGK